MRNDYYLSLINFKVKISSSETFYDMNSILNPTQSSLKKASDDEVFTLKLVWLK